MESIALLMRDCVIDPFTNPGNQSRVVGQLWHQSSVAVQQSDLSERRLFYWRRLIATLGVQEQWKPKI